MTIDRVLDPPSDTRRVRRLVGTVVLTAVTLAAWAPLASLVTAALLVMAFGCADNRGPNPPCVVGGVDVGPVLHVMTYAAWLMLGTWPLMILTALAWCGVLAWTVLRRIRRARAER